MLPESVYLFIEPHIKGYTDKQQEELIKLIQKDKKAKPRARSKDEIQQAHFKESFLSRKKRKS